MNEWEWRLLEERSAVESVEVGGAALRVGDRVRLRPRAGGDIFDLALDGRAAVIESLEQDYEGRVHLAVVLEDDPGRDLGMLKQPGHRFFFSPAEVEPAKDEAAYADDEEAESVDDEETVFGDGEETALDEEAASVGDVEKLSRVERTGGDEA